MSEFTIPCEVIARLSVILENLPPDLEPSFNTFRIEDGLLIVTDRRFMAVECIGGANVGTFHFVPDAALIAQCKTEAAFHSTLTIVVNEMLHFAVAKTTFGFNSGNIGYWLPVCTEFNRWREVVLQSQVPAEASRGGMFWNVEGLTKLARSSPTGRVVFEERIDADRPTIIRDVSSYEWLGVFQPWSKQDNYQPATMPNWIAK